MTPPPWWYPLVWWVASSPLAHRLRGHTVRSHHVTHYEGIGLMYNHYCLTCKDALR